MARVAPLWWAWLAAATALTAQPGDRAADSAPLAPVAAWADPDWSQAAERRLLGERRHQVACTVVQEGYTWLDFHGASVVYNNLGGSVQGLPPYLQFSGIGQYQGRALQLRIAEEKNATLQLRNTRLRSTYAMSDGGSNGLMVDDLGFSQMGRINLAAPRTPINEPTHRQGSWLQRHWPQGHDPGHSFVDLTMCILDENERKVVLPAFEFTFVDIDHGRALDPAQLHQPRECIMVTGFDRYKLSDLSGLEVTNVTSSLMSRARFCSIDGGDRAHAPSDPLALTREQMAVSVSLSFKDTACFGVSLSVRCCSDEGRDFLFSGKSSMTPPICESPPSSSAGSEHMKHYGI
eukprot:Transcript_25520.p1 GENE.Transcript_25520~~Transcript_25520.p1  ORF type:complete len:348 (-),score=32.61 Transcript_25520:78-1121(-)